MDKTTHYDEGGVFAERSMDYQNDAPAVGCPFCTDPYEPSTEWYENGVRWYACFTCGVQFREVRNR